MEDIIKSIKRAEEDAAQMKNDALAKAAQILEAAQIEAQSMENAAAEANKEYREQQLLIARSQADKEYAYALQQKEKEARAYCEAVLLNSEVSIEKIVGRILSGDC